MRAANSSSCTPTTRAHAHAHESALARTDALTGIANRREFDDTLNSELARLQRAGAPLSLILMDVDHFKAYNDNYGQIRLAGSSQRRLPCWK